MWCPRCGNDKSKVLNTVKSGQNERFRRCEKCAYTWQTIEVPKYDGYIKKYVKNLFEDENK